MALLKGKDVMVGVIDVASDVVETTEDVADTIGRALQFVPRQIATRRRPGRLKDSCALVATRSNTRARSTPAFSASNGTAGGGT
jgi:hypothetical protein